MAEIVEYKVRVIAENQAAAERLMYDALAHRMGAVWTRADTPVRVLDAATQQVLPDTD